jgi:hypothetical protein
VAAVLAVVVLAASEVVVLVAVAPVVVGNFSKNQNDNEQGFITISIVILILNFIP